MAKMTVEQKRVRLRELEQIISTAEKEIHELLESAKQAEMPSTLPDGFSLNEKVLEIISSHDGEGVSKSLIKNILKDTHGVVVSSSQIQSTLAYLKNTKGMLDIVGRGVYKLKQT